MKAMLHIVTLPGDGIGPEVMASGVAVLRRAAERFALDVAIEEIPCGGRYYLDHPGRDWPEGSEERCAAADLILLGAVGWPSPDGRGPVMFPDGRMAGYSAVLGNRSRLDLFANVRPIKLYPGVFHRIHGARKLVWDPAKVDLVFVRENTEGFYSGAGGILAPGGRADVGTDTRVITRRGSERILRHAFELARERARAGKKNGKARVTVVSKDNVLRGCQMFCAIAREIARDYPDVEVEHALVDSFAMMLVTDPEKYDVVVSTNMFGDILTDLGAVLQGGMGLAIGGNVGVGRAMFEPIHGSAPALAGKDAANPMAMILAVAESLRWLSREKRLDAARRAGDAIESAVADVLASGAPLTQDLAAPGEGATCSAVTEAIVRALRA